MVKSIQHIDQMQRTVELKSTVLRIVSLVPSQTELLVDLGLEEQIVGVTKFCIHPADLRSKKTVVGGTKQIKLDVIDQLNPNLIIGNKEENRREDIEKLEEKYPVWMSDISTLDDALEMIRLVGELTQTKEKASVLCTEIGTAFSNLTSQIGQLKSLKVLYLIWKNPYMAAGKNTFIDDLLLKIGFENIMTETRYPEVDLQNIQPDVLFLSSEPYPFKNNDLVELQQFFPQTRIYLVDGEYFSWYGSRLKETPVYFAKLLKNF